MLRITNVVCVLCILSISILWGGSDVKVNQDVGPLLQNEATLTLNPAAPGNVIVAYNEDPGGSHGATNGLGISYSFNYGATWSDTQIVQVWGVEGDPCLDASTTGRIYAGFISYQGFFNDTNGIYVAYSTDSGQTWSTPVTVDSFLNTPSSLGPFTDKCFLCVDNHSGSPYTDYVYITWQRDNTNGVNSDVYFAASYDGGQTYTGPQQISDLIPPAGECVGQVPKAAPDGDVYVLWCDFGLSGHTTGYLYIDVSTDSGTNWGTDVLIDSFLVVPRYPNAPMNTTFYVRSYPTIGIDPSNSNNIYAAVAADPDGLGGLDDGDIHFWRSTNGGTTWSGPVTVNDDNTTMDQFQPWMDVKTSGRIDVVWLDRRNDPSDQNFDIYFAYSTDCGQSFSTNMRVTDVTFPLLADPNGWLGEYIGIDVDQNTAYIAWADTRNLDRDIYFDSIQNPVVNINELDMTIREVNITRIFPNPFNTEATIEFSMPVADFVEFRVYDASGKLVENLLEKHLEAGIHELVWRSHSESGMKLPAGVYFLEINMGNQFDVKKVVLLE